MSCCLCHRSLVTYEDGMVVGADTVHVYGEQNLGKVPSKLDTALSGFNLTTDIFVGSRADENGFRRFVGHIANLEVSTLAYSAEAAQCAFKLGEDILPSIDEICGAVRQGDCDITFLNDKTDTAGGRQVTVAGAVVSATGVTFKSAKDHVEIAKFGYADDAEFTISFWMTKQNYTSGAYEYVYSHSKQNKFSWMSDSNINIYWAEEGKGFSTFGGTALRVHMIDRNGTFVTVDVPLHEAGDFDKVTSKWIHFTLVVTTTRMSTYLDGVPLKDSLYAFHRGAQDSKTSSNIVAAPNAPSKFGKKLEGFDLQSNIFLGGRSDQNAYRYFLGSLSLLKIWTRPLNLGMARCVFNVGDDMLPTTWTPPSEANTLATNGTLKAIGKD